MIDDFCVFESEADMANEFDNLIAQTASFTKLIEELTAAYSKKERDLFRTNFCITIDRIKREMEEISQKSAELQHKRFALRLRAEKIRKILHPECINDIALATKRGTDSVVSYRSDNTRRSLIAGISRERGRMKPW